MKEAKTPKRSTKRINTKENSTAYKYLEEYRDEFTYLMKPLSQAGLDKMCHDYRHEAQQPNFLFIADFYDKHGIPKGTYYIWVGKYENFKQSHEFAKRQIANRRERGAIMRDFDPGFIKASMPMYSAKWRRNQEREALLKQPKETTDSKTINIIMQAAPNTDKIKALEHKEEENV